MCNIFKMRISTYITNAFLIPSATSEPLLNDCKKNYMKIINEQGISSNF